MIVQPLPWYISGALIALIMFLLLKLGRRFGMSSNLETFCSITGAGKIANYFNKDWTKNTWSLWIVAGAIFGGFLCFNIVGVSASQIHVDVVKELELLGILSTNKSFLPDEIYGLDSLMSLKGFLIIICGGFLVGFGARYAGGCTSGHAISGLSNLQLPSLISVIGFFIGGLIMINFIFPLIF